LLALFDYLVLSLVTGYLCSKIIVAGLFSFVYVVKYKDIIWFFLYSLIVLKVSISKMNALLN